MKILFVTGLYDRESELTYNKHCRNGCSTQNAPNVFQWCIVDGLASNNADFYVVSYPFLPSYPLGYSKIHIKKTPIIHNGKVIGTIDKYCTLNIFKSKSIFDNLYKFAREFIESYKDEKIVILLYAPASYVLSAAAKLKNEFTNVSICMIVTDMVDDMLSFASNRTPIKRIQVKLEQKIITSLYKEVDKYVLLSKHMCDRIPYATTKNHLVVEGISNCDTTITPKQDSSTRCILYTGTLQKFACVDDLVTAFMKIKMDNIQLVICGSGPLQQMIEEAANKDGRIVFKGLVTREESIKLQKEATVLINPRKPNGCITKYSFPSKTMEYLSSGTPMIGYKLEGIPEEYYPYYYTIKSTDESDLITTITKVISLPQEELNHKAIMAYKFIKENKSSHNQVRRILSFLES